MSCRDLDESLLETFTGRAMATRVTILAAGIRPGSASDAANAALQLFQEVDRSCTRFDIDSPLMRANRTPTSWHRVPPTLFGALKAAKRAHDMTEGRFDPRVLRHLCALGYDRTLPFERGTVSTDTRPLPRRPSVGQWRPRLRGSTHEVLLGEEPVDLGGIGKGLAVRWASGVLRRTTPNFVVEAGGDCYAAGAPPGEKAWRIGVEDPDRPQEPACVLAVSGRAVTTSSIRLRHWASRGGRVHHLIDPVTGEPGGRGLVAVTVVAPDPADAEVWSKVLFLEGRAAVANRARREGLAALWIDEHGAIGTSTQLTRYLLWRRD